MIQMYIPLGERDRYALLSNFILMNLADPEDLEALAEHLDGDTAAPIALPLQGRSGHGRLLPRWESGLHHQKGKFPDGA